MSTPPPHTRAAPARRRPVREVPLVPAPAVSLEGTLLDQVLQDPACARLLDREQALANRTGQSFTLVGCDSTTADARESVLQALQTAVTAGLRSCDQVWRVASGPLVVLLPGTSRDEATRTFERLLGQVPTPRSAFTLDTRVLDPVPRTPSARRASSGVCDQPPAPGITWDERGVSLLLGRELPRWKRSMDVVLASLGLIVASPLMLLIALGIKLTSPGPILFEQWRTGRSFRRFRLYKFRSMHPQADQHLDELEHLNQMTGPLFKSDDDPRIYRLGKLLRKTSMDELPQLYNVLRGDMTLIGPRALSPKPSEYEPWQLRRFDVTPGIACTWQASRRSDTDFEDWMRSDLEYVQRNPGPWDDLRLLVRTVLAVLRCAGGR